MGDVHYLSSFAQLEVADLEASVLWYEAVLGFRPVGTYDLNGATAVHLRRGEGQDLLLTEAHSDALLNYATDSDLAGIAAQARMAGSQGNFRPEHGDEPETLDLRDPDGHVLRVYTRQRPTSPVR
jgi:catechol 2,3-dioxygenase-like lactoylglutathione lyase family enzyme